MKFNEIFAREYEKQFGVKKTYHKLMMKSFVLGRLCLISTITLILVFLLIIDPSSGVVFDGYEILILGPLMFISFLFYVLRIIIKNEVDQVLATEVEVSSYISDEVKEYLKTYQLGQYYTGYQTIDHIRHAYIAYKMVNDALIYHKNRCR